MNNSGRLDRDDLLKKFNTDELIQYLNDVVDTEIKKSDEMDTDIIDECVDWILELKGIQVKLSEEEIKRRVRSIIAKQNIPKKRKFRFLYIAASIIVIIFSVQAISITAFSFNFFDWTKEQFLTLLGIEEYRDDTSYLASHSRRYNTVEELEKAENIDIVVPTWLPGDIEIKDISYIYEFDERQVVVAYTDNLTGLSIKFDSLIYNTRGTKIYEKNNVLYYIFTEANVILWEYGGNFYNLTCGFDVVECAEKIIENIK